MKIIGIIPARYASTRLEGKPLMDLCGKPMIQHVYERAKIILNHVLVATDDKRIFDTVKNFGGEVVMTAENHNTGTNRCLEAYKKHTQSTGETFEVVINIQGDEPLLEPEQIETLTKCFDAEDTEMATLVIPSKPMEKLSQTGVFVVFDKYCHAMYFSRSVIPFVRDAKPAEWTSRHTFYRHVGMYGFRPKALEEFANIQQTSLEKAESLEQNRWLENGKKIRVGITTHETIPVDTKEDVEIVRMMMKNKMLVK
ncbi:MAG: 3-deoxy-manno-octulosonate cytidylyltransferase [Flavobacteriales bacterium CG_4_9_14_3_um_filter_40_17]|nr:MAG: 3-deoxy-manno-octulosonate cytidylyltransferase [Flavobacteriales bacterium CG_4_9_14_3_um_filter_40_17]